MIDFVKVTRKLPGKAQAFLKTDAPADDKASAVEEARKMVENPDLEGGGEVERNDTPEADDNYESLTDIQETHRRWDAEADRMAVEPCAGSFDKKHRIEKVKREDCLAGRVVAAESSEEPRASVCPDCGALAGQRHRGDCDVERCSDCGGQRVGCDCEGHDQEASAWSGEYPPTAGPCPGCGGREAPANIRVVCPEELPPDPAVEARPPNLPIEGHSPANRRILFDSFEEARGFVLGVEWVNDGAITVGSPYHRGDGAWVVPAHDSESDDEEEVWDYRDGGGRGDLLHLPG